MNTKSGDKKITDALVNETIWGVLTKCRIEKGLSVEDIVRQLKIPEGYVIALEQGQFEVLPAPAFARGYLRNYARLLELDEQELVKNYNDSMEDEYNNDVLIDTPKSNIMENRSSSLLRFIITLLSVFVIIIFSYWWHQSKTSSIPINNKELSIEEEIDPPISGSTTDGASAGTSLKFEESVVVVDDPNEENINVANDLNSISMLQQLDVTNLYIHFTDDCWMEIRNKMGEVLMTGIKRAGADFDMMVPVTIKLWIGNAKGVGEIRFGGRNVDILTSLAGKKVAKLTLNALNI